MAVIVNVNCKHIARYSYACNKKKRILGIFKRICVETDICMECDIADRIFTEENRPKVRAFSVNRKSEEKNKKEILGGYILERK